MPLIGISGSVDKEEKTVFILRDYMRGLTEAGGAPVLLCPDMTAAELDACVTGLSGLMLAGGNDIAPGAFGQEPIAALGEVNPMRDDFEMKLIRAFLRAGKPVFGICRGVQALNVAMGGDLWQDIPSQYRRADGTPPMAHQQTCLGRYPSHEVRLAEQCLLKRILGVETLPVNSFHHQAVKSAAPGCQISASAADGMIEAIEFPDYPFALGVQWHPERMFDTDPLARKLFEAFVQATSK